MLTAIATTAFTGWKYGSKKFVYTQSQAVIYTRMQINATVARPGRACGKISAIQPSRAVLPTTQKTVHVLIAFQITFRGIKSASPPYPTAWNIRQVADAKDVTTTFTQI